MKSITIRVEEDVYLAVQRRAAERGVSASQLVVEYLRALSREDKLRAERARRLGEVFRMADQRFQTGPVGPFSRDEIYKNTIH